MNFIKALKVGMVFAVVGGVGYFTVSTDSGVDGTTGATPVGEVVLPEKSDNYKTYIVEGLKNYIVKYTDDFYRGGMIESIEGVEKLKFYNVNTVVSITPDDRERGIAKEHGFDLVELEFTYEDMSADVIDEFVETIEVKKGPFYVHCHGGTHRAGIFAMLYRIKKHGWSYEQAKNEFVALGGYPEKDKKMLNAVRAYLGKYNETSGIER